MRTVGPGPTAQRPNAGAPFAPGPMMGGPYAGGPPGSFGGGPPGPQGPPRPSGPGTMNGVNGGQMPTMPAKMGSIGPPGPSGQFGPPRPMGPPGINRPQQQQPPASNGTSHANSGHPQQNSLPHHPGPGSAPRMSGMGPPSSNPGMGPPSSNPGMGPHSSNPGMMPPTSNPGMMPPSSNPGMGPPSSNPGMMPPSSNPGMMPPSSNLGMMPPSSNPGMVPPSSNPGMMPPTSNPGMMPRSSTPSMMQQPSSGPGMMPPSSNPGMMPPSSNPGMMPPSSNPGMMPPTSNPGMMPPMTGHPQQPSRRMMPPGSGPGMGPPSSGPGMGPPSSGPGMGPPSSGPGMGPPSSGPGMGPPSSGPGMMPPGMRSSSAAGGGMPNQGSMMPPTSNRGGMMPPMSNQGPYMGGGPPRPSNGPVMGMPPTNMPPMGMMPPQQPQQQPGYPGSAPATSPGRRTLDPDQMPSPIHVMEEDQRQNTGYFDTREKGASPPLVTTKFIVRDYGNASPRFIRSTMYHVPATEELRKQTGVPFGLVLTPLAPVDEGELEPPLSDFGPTGPVRCMRCKAYMCSLMQFIDGGRRFQCVFCKATTEVPPDYFQHLDHNGMRVDHYQRPELCLGTYECVATKDYCRDSVPPKVPGVLFAIDVSYPMIKEGVVQLICSNMKSMLAHLPRDMHCDKERMRVGFMTYDSKINFYNIKAALTQPQQMTVGDVNDMFVPLVDGFMCTVEESEAVIDSLMEQIPRMFAETRETETVLGPVIQAGKEAFKAANCAGKLIVFHHNLPVAEAPGKLKNRDDRKVLGTEKEKTVLTPQNKMYNTFGQECVAVGCSVDLFVFNNAYIDVATISQVCRLSGGQLYKYTYFQPDLDGERFLADLRHNLSRPVVFDAIMRVRTSTGVRPVEFFGNFYMANTTDTELAALNSDMSIACEIKYDDKLTEEDGVYIQAALLFTSCSGQRRLRIINLALNAGTSMAEMYRNCELDTIINFTAKQSISRLMDSNPKTVKEGLIGNCAQILACYRKNCASPSSAGQLILPECMKLLPLYTNCLLKSDALSGGADVGCDDRAQLMSTVSSMDVASTVVFFYPRLFPIHDLSEPPAASDEDKIQMPNPVRCTMDKIKDDGVYLLENGIYLFMYIGLAADPGWIQAVFGVQTAAQIDIDKTRLVDRDNCVSKHVRGIIDQIRAQRPRQHMRLVLVRQRDKLDILFRHYLCEDRAAPGSSGGGSDNFSYVDFLCHMHKEIRALLG